MYENGFFGLENVIIYSIFKKYLLCDNRDLGIQIWLLADRGEERIIRRDDAPSAAPQGSPPPAEEKSKATLRSVSTTDLQLPTERKYCYIDSALGFQTWLSADRGEERIFRRDCCPVSSPSEPPCTAKGRGGNGSPPLPLESHPSSRHGRTSNRCVARALHIRLSAVSLSRQPKLQVSLYK